MGCEFEHRKTSIQRVSVYLPMRVGDIRTYQVYNIYQVPGTIYYLPVPVGDGVGAPVERLRALQEN